MQIGLPTYEADKLNDWVKLSFGGQTFGLTSGGGAGVELPENPGWLVLSNVFTATATNGLVKLLIGICLWVAKVRNCRDAVTIIIFMSDNGGLSTAEGSPTSNRPLRAGKGWPYEGGVREPMIVVAPSVTKLGTVCDVPVISTDFNPTLLQLKGHPLKLGQHLDGVGFLPLLKGESAARGKPFFWHYPHYTNQGGAPNGVIRDGDWKLIEWYEDGALELYNIPLDIGEKNNVAAQQPEKTKALHQKLIAWRKEVGALMPTPNQNRSNSAGNPGKKDK